MNELDRAIADYDAVLARNPTSVEPRCLRAAAQWHKGERLLAVKDAAKATATAFAEVIDKMQSDG